MSLVLRRPIPTRRREHVPSKLLRTHRVLEPEPLVTRKGPRVPERLGRRVSILVTGRHPSGGVTIDLPRLSGDGDGVGG